MTEIDFILVIAIVLFVLYVIKCGCNMDAFKQKKKLGFESTPQTNGLAMTTVTTSQPEVKTTTKQDTEDDYQGILMNSVVDGINSTGIISSNNVNSGLVLGDETDPDVNKYKLDYNNIVENEIGQDNIKSQQQYKKYVKSDSGIRFLDTDLSANYGNFYGLSLTRSQNRGNKISATNSTQISNISENEFDSNSANLRDFFVKN